jgi:hypothetical protein
MVSYEYHEPRHQGWGDTLPQITPYIFQKYVNDTLILTNPYNFFNCAV